MAALQQIILRFVASHHPSFALRCEAVALEPPHVALLVVHRPELIVVVVRQLLTWRDGMG